MANGLQIAASGLIAQEYRLDTVANDIANVDTVGYQQSRTAFSEVLGSSGGVRVVRGRHDRRGRRRSPRATTRSRSARRARLHPGSRRRRAVALTRDGDLRIDGARKLVTSSGAKVDPAITIPADVSAAESPSPPTAPSPPPAASSARSRSSTCPRPTGSRPRRRPADDDRRSGAAKAAEHERVAPAGRARAVERRSRLGPHRDDGGAARIPAREPRAPHPGSAARDRERDPPLMSES